MKFWKASSRRASLIGLALLVTTFLVGGLAGAATERVLSAAEPAGECDRRDRGKRGDESELLARLDLTPEQRQQVDRILERRREQMSAFWKEHRHQLRAIVDSTRVEVRALLTPEQRAEEERLWAERKAHFKKRGERDGSREEKRTR